VSASLTLNITATAEAAVARITELEDEVELLRGHLAARDYTINDMCDEIYELRRQLARRLGLVTV
jgi:phage shock protein A